MGSPGEVYHLVTGQTMSDPDMGTWSYGYDNNGNLTSQTDAKNQTTNMTYDALNRLTGKTYPAGSGMTDVMYTYDSTSGDNYGKGKRTGMSDYFGANSSTWKYDNRGRLVEEIRLIDTYYYTTKYAYDGADRLYQTIYPSPSTTYPIANGETVTQTYNGRGLLYGLSGTQAGSLVTSTLYNGLGALTEINLYNTSGSTRTTYGYYGTGGAYDTTGGYYGRLWEIKTTKQTAGTILQDIRHSWDGNGNLTQRQTWVNETSTWETESFTYDYLDRLTGVNGAYLETFSYDTVGNITAKNGNSYTYGSQPHAMTAVGSTSYEYDNNGNMITRGTQTITWNVENKPISMSGDSQIYEWYHATNDSTGLDTCYVAQTFTPQTSHTINSFKMLLYNSSASSGTITGYLRATDGNGAPTGPDLAISQVVDESSIPSVWTEVTFTFSSGCALTAGTRYALIIHPTVSGLSARIDVNGTYSGGQECASSNGISWNMSNSTWDAWFEEYSSDSAASFIYDGDGQRIKKTEGGETILYINQYYEKNLTTSEVTTYYYHGGKLVAQRKGGTLNYIHQDSLGSTSVMSDEAGASEGTISYFPFGSARLTSGTIDTDKLFTGQRLDSTGLYYYGARYYDPEIGRFISPDTIVPNPSNPQSLNRYSYCLNNPLKYIDPSGNFVEIGEGALLDWIQFCEEYPDLALELGRSDTHYIFEKSLPVDNSGTGLNGAPDATIPNGNGGSYDNEVQQPEPALPDASDIVSGITSGITKTIPRYGLSLGLKVLGLAGMIGGLLFIQGDAPRPAENVYYHELIDDFKNNPSNWDKISSKSEQATGRAYKGGTSVEENFRNRQTGEILERHRIYKPSGKIAHEHFRVR